MLLKTLNYLTYQKEEESKEIYLKSNSLLESNS